MTTPDFKDLSLFEGTRISSDVTVESSQKFFQPHGVFYQASAEIGKIASELEGVKYETHHINLFKPVINRDQRLANVLGPFLEQAPSFCTPIGPDKGNFYSLTLEPNQDHRAVIYMFFPGTKLEFSYGSHVGPANGKNSSWGRIHRPYVNLNKTRGLKDVSIDFEEGGILIVHSRLAFQVLSGKGIGFGCEM